MKPVRAMRILDDDEAIYSHWAIAEASAKDRVPPLARGPSFRDGQNAENIGLFAMSAG